MLAASVAMILLVVLQAACVGKAHRNRAAAGSDDTTMVSLEALRATRLFDLEEEVVIDPIAENLDLFYHIAVRHDGVMAIPQPSDRQILLFSPDGKLVSRAGGRGDGPGELRTVSSIGFLGDSLWVRSGSTDITMYDQNGAFAHDIRYWILAPSVADAGRYPIATQYEVMVPGADGAALVAVRENVIGATTFNNGGQPIMLVNSFGFFVRQVGRIPDGLQRLGAGTIIGCPLRVPEVAQEQPFAPIPLYHFNGNGAFFATVATNDIAEGYGVIAVSLLTTEGDTIFARTLEFEGLPIPKSVRDSTIERWTERARRLSARGACGTPDPGFAVQYFQALRSSTPRFYPPVSVAVTGLDGSLLLLGRWTPAGQSWLQLGTDGQPVGRLVLPDNEVLMQATLGQAWVRRTDDVGLQSVVRYKLKGPTRP